MSKQVNMFNKQVNMTTNIPSACRGQLTSGHDPLMFGPPVAIITMVTLLVGQK